MDSLPKASLSTAPTLVVILSLCDTDEVMDGCSSSSNGNEDGDGGWPSLVVVEEDRWGSNGQVAVPS